MMRGLTAAAAMIAAVLTGCEGNLQRAATVASGPERSAPELMRQYGCPSCHTIPRVPGAVGKVGPSLEAIGQRSYIAGSLENTPENLRNWIMHPQQYRPKTAMPEMGVTAQDAQHIAEFLENNR